MLYSYQVFTVNLLTKEDTNTQSDGLGIFPKVTVELARINATPEFLAGTHCPSD
jgi:hypothetical protein